MHLKLVFLLLVAVAVALFALQNSQSVTVHLLFYAVQGVSVALLILVTAAVTVGATSVLSVSEWLRHRGELNRLRHEIAQRDARIAELERQAPGITELPQLAGGTAEDASPTPQA